jgi:hypothetical protein
MIQDWVLWVPVMAAAIGAAIGAASSISTALVADLMRGRREMDARRHADIDMAEQALKEIGRKVVDQLLSPHWWPSFRLLHLPREFAYDVARLVQDDAAVTEWADAWQEAIKVNTNLWGVWLWNVLRVDGGRRARLLDRLLAAELAVVAAAEQRRSGGGGLRRLRKVTPA